MRSECTWEKMTRFGRNSREVRRQRMFLKLLTYLLTMNIHIMYTILKKNTIKNPLLEMTEAAHVKACAEMVL